jgi:GAF domain-containing protein
VFDAMLEKAMRLCEASGGALRSYDGEVFHAAAMRGVPTAFAEATQVVRAHPETGLGRIEHGERVVHIADLSDPALPAPTPQRRREMLDLGGIRTALWVALRKDEALLGTFVLYRDQVRPFTDKQIALVENFAAQAVIAMENARLLTETREALDQQTATAEVLQVINSSPGDLLPVFEAILDKAHALCGAERGTLFLYDGEKMKAAVAQGYPADVIEHLRAGVEVPPHHAPLFSGNHVHVPDLSKDNNATGRVVSGRGGVRTNLLVPLFRNGVLLGMISCNRTEVRPFSDKEIALIENFAQQAVIAIENARLIAETREALEQQTATAEVLQVINASPGDLAPVFDAMLERALRLCEAALGVLFTYDGEYFHLAAHRGFSRGSELLEMGRDRPQPGPDTGFGRIVRGERLVHIVDITDTDAYRNNDPIRRATADVLGARTSIFVALVKDDVLLGGMHAYRREVRPFTDKQIALLQNFADQAVIAMENARLINETQEALDQQTATAEVLGVINASPGDLAPVFDVMVERAAHLCEADEAAVRTFSGTSLHLAATYGADPSALEQLRKLGPTDLRGLYEPFARGDDIAHYEDARDTDAYRNFSSGRNRIDARGIRSWLAVALRKEGTLLGIINVHRRNVRPFTDKQIALLQSFAAQAVIAMENARLLTETREALDQQTATAEVLGVINASPGELQPVFDIILEKAMALCDVSEGDLELYDGNTFRAVATLGLTDAFAEQVRRGYPASDNPATRPLIAGERFSHIVDMADADFSKVFTHEPVKDEGHHTLLCVPLRREGRLLGMIASARKEVRPFSEKEIALLENFAQQAVIAIENARLLGELRQRTEEVAELNRGLEARVAEQVDELGRVGRLKRFLAPQLAELIVSQGDEKILESHRREIVVVFCDLRGYTAFTETAEPEEVLDFLREYHGALGPLVAEYEGTLDQFSGDGIMVFFNDPVPISDPAERAVAMAMAMREAAGTLTAAWRRRGRDLGFGVGIAQGYATLGQIGFSERSGYTAIGTVCNVAARLCGEAKDGQILLSQRVAAGLGGDIALEEIGALTLKGLTQPVITFNVVDPEPGANRLRLV